MMINHVSWSALCGACIGQPVSLNRARFSDLKSYTVRHGMVFPYLAPGQSATPVNFLQTTGSCAVFVPSSPWCTVRYGSPSKKYYLYLLNYLAIHTYIWDYLV